MINTHIMQELFENSNHYIGFEIDPRSGTVRMIELTMRKMGLDLTVNDVVDTLLYMLSRDWLRESGVYLGRQLYSVQGKHRDYTVSEWCQMTRGEL